MLETIN